MSRHQLKVEHRFKAELPDVYQRLADHERLGQVFGVPCHRIQAGESDPDGTGSVRRISLWPLAIEETVVDSKVGRFIDYRITRGGWPLRDHRGRISFSQKAGEVLVEWEIHFNAPINLLGLVIASGLQRIIGRGLKKIDI